MRPLVIDNFAGGGGASTGIERAIGRAIDVAINHDPEAVAMHLANHPGTKHYCQSILAVDPLDATGGAPVALVWFSPDCKHHSKAKGGKPREKNIRDLAWVVVHWAERLLKATPDGSGAPQVIMLENVEEFRQWGPLDEDGRPIKERQGEEFDLWCRRLKRLGYKLQYRELRACDYGAPTSRKRLYLIARRDGLPIVWPEPTHGKPGSAEVLAGKRLPWRTAAECIDWSIPCPSIFSRKRPLKDATLRRIAHGTMRYVVNAATPFIVGCGGRRAQSAPVSTNSVYPTTTSKADACVVDAAIVPITHTTDPTRVHDPADPMRTITTANGGEFGRATVTLAPHITKFRTGSVGSDASAPMPTVTANGDSARPAGATPLGI
ncbi:MAG: DNA cytosine methyltransferase, partial [Sphingomonas parapaucimobilis]